MALLFCPQFEHIGLNLSSGISTTPAKLKLFRSANSEKVTFMRLKLNKLVTLILGNGNTPLCLVSCLQRKVFPLLIFLCIYVNSYGDEPFFLTNRVVSSSKSIFHIA